MNRMLEDLSKKLSLPYTGNEQDWDIEMADPERLDYFLDYFQNHNLSDDEKVLLLSLILASYDDYLNQNVINIDSKWSIIENIVKENRTIYSEVLDYWALKNNDNDLFKITPLIRNLGNISD